MVKLIVMYGPQSDAAKFDDYYLSTHIPIVEKTPGLRGVEVGKCSSLDGSTPPYYVHTELYFDDVEAMMTAFGTPEGQAMAADVANFVSGDVTMLVAEVLKERSLRPV